MQEQQSTSLLVIGECMMELSGEDDIYHRAFAGDIYNTAVYAKRCKPDLDVQILTALGTDSISHAMRGQWAAEGIGDNLVLTSPTSHPGIYSISTDQNGERSFTYWRKHSAATEMIKLMTPEVREQLSRFDLIYFSGISVAILADDDKAQLLDTMAQLKAQGTRIAFDPNYRPILWRNKAHAAEWIDKAYRITDIALPGLADHADLFDHKDEGEVSEYLAAIGTEEVVVKAEERGIFGYHKGEEIWRLHITPDPAPVDTTGAGDSFAGTYLAQRLTSAPVSEAMEVAAHIAALVIKHRGAIVDRDSYANAQRRQQFNP